VPYSAQTWRDLESYRRLFPRKLVVKGVMHPGDAIRAAEIGVDGVIVSNHGGRQLDQAPASLDVLPAVNAAVGERLTVMLDGGVRRGADILIAPCLGARFVFLGRPLRRRRRRHFRGQEGNQHLAQRDRSRHGPDRLSEPRRTRSRFPVARGLDREPLSAAAQLPADDSERSISSIVRPLVSKPIHQKAAAPSRYQKAK
jgi:hypothetical protein